MVWQTRARHVQASLLAALPVSLGRKTLLGYSNEGSAAGVVQARAMAHECLEALSMRLGNDLFFGGSKCAGIRTQPCNIPTACNMQDMQRAACGMQGMQHARRATCNACNMRHAGYTLCESTHDHTHGCAWPAHTMCFPPKVPRMSMRSVLQRRTTHCNADRRVLQRI